MNMYPRPKNAKDLLHDAMRECRRLSTISKMLERSGGEPLEPLALHELLEPVVMELDSLLSELDRAMPLTAE